MIKVHNWVLWECDPCVGAMLYRHLEVAGVDPQLVGVQCLQGLQADSQLADVLGCLRDGQDDLLPMREQVWRAATYINVGEVRLAAWVGGEHPGWGKTRRYSRPNQDLCWDNGRCNSSGLLEQMHWGAHLKVPCYYYYEYYYYYYHYYPFQIFNFHLQLQPSMINYP